VAAGGFHSQAGWIAFNVVALGLSVISRQARWMTTEHARALDAVAHNNPVAPYLVPALVILAAGMVARAVSGGFEWLYPLRVVSAVLVLWYFRSRYQDFNWRGMARVGRGRADVCHGLALTGSVRLPNGIAADLRR
jgi:hypothetical protein